MANLLTLTLVVDKEKNRVVFAEADKDFVDILFSFLTLPLGTVVRLLGKQSMVGSVDKLYESIENLEAECLETKACKTMLLQPRSEAEELCENLKISVNDLKPRRFYTCPSVSCLKSRRLFSLVSDVRCPCGNAMDKGFECRKAYIGNGDGIFVKGSNNRFIVSDDLHVTPALSTGTTLSFLRKHGIKDTEELENKAVDITRDKILTLLKRLMLSTTPLTDIFLLNLDTMGCGNEDQECYQLKGITQIKSEDDSTAKSMPSIRVKVLYDKVSKKLVFVQGGDDFVDVIFSFFTFPLGCIVKLLDRNSSVGCLDNLYKSVEIMDVASGMKSDECKNLLLAPKLETHFGCSNQILGTEEKKPSPRARVYSCNICSSATFVRTCGHGAVVAEDLTQVNPKLSSSATECGGGYAKKSVRLMFTSDMVVSPLSPLSEIDAIKQSKAPIHNLVEKEVVLEEAEVANLLKACLISRTALTVFFSKKMKMILY